MGEQDSQELPWEVTALAAVDQPVLVTDGVVVLYANAAARQFLGEDDDVAGRRIADVSLRMLDRAGHEVPFDESTIAKALASGLPAALTGRLAWPDGRERWVQARSTPVTVGSQRLVVTVANDIGELIHAQEALRAGEKRLQDIVDALGSSVFVKDIDGHYTFVNQRFLHELGMASREVLGRTTADLTAGVALERVQAQDVAVTELGERVTEVLAWECAPGEIRSYLSVKVPLRDETGRVTGIVGVATDVTDQTQAQETNERLAAIVRGSPDAMVTVDRDGRITGFNPAAELLTGADQADALGGLLPGVATGNNGEIATEMVREALAGRVIEPVEITRSTDAGLQVFMVSARPIGATPEAVTGAVFFARDVTSEHAAQAERLELERRVEHMERLESLGQLAGGVAHDFNNLLAAISLTAELLHSRLAPESFEREQADRLLEMTQRGVSLTKQLLVFARREPQSLTSVDVNAVVRRTDELLARVLGEHIERRLQLCDDPALVTGDARLVEQLIVNLATNSRDAMPGGGVLRIQTSLIELDDAGRQLYRTATTGTYVQLIVEDEGEGMPAEVRAHAFEPFFTTKAAGEGTGLGLAAVYSIASQSGGGAAIYSEPGVGTVVRVVMPATSEAPAVSIEAPPLLEATEAQGELVVVVEDEDDLRQIARGVLERAGYEVLAYGDGFAALHDAESWPREPDVLLTDVVLPRLSGPQLAFSLREKFPAMRVVLMSGYTAGLVAQDPDAAGVILLEKPFRAETLLVALRQALDAPPG